MPFLIISMYLSTCNSHWCTGASYTTQTITRVMRGILTSERANRVISMEVAMATKKGGGSHPMLARQQGSS